MIDIENIIQYDKDDGIKSDINRDLHSDMHGDMHGDMHENMKRRRWNDVRQASLFRFITVWMLFLCFSLPGPGKEDAAPESILLKAHEEGRAIPLLSRVFPRLDTASAYLIQRRFVRMKGDGIAGYKAGLTSLQGMKRFGLNEPVTGVLPLSGGRVNGTTVSAGELHAHALMVETELGYILQTPVGKRLPDVAALKRHIGFLLPVIELPDLGFDDLKNLKGTDIIAANVGAAGFITGEKVRIAGLVPDETVVTLTRDGVPVNGGRGGDVLNGQWETALWMVNGIVERGGKLDEGDMIITGVLGKMIPAAPGNYTADYGALGKITFRVK